MSNLDLTKLNVKIDFGGESVYSVGTLYYSKDKATNIFEYDPKFFETGFEISPIELPLESDVFEAGRDKDFYSLHYVFADALPDKWGRDVQDIEFEIIGVIHPTPLQRLAFIGKNGLGALTFEPPQKFEEGQTITDVAKLRKDTQKIIEGDVSHVSKELLKIGGSAGGARPKFLVDYNLQTKKLRYTRDSHEGMFIPVILKVPFNNNEDPDRFQKAEYCYCQMAKYADINVPDTYLIPDNEGNVAFAIERFDVKPTGERLHMHTLSGIIHKNYTDRDTTYNDLMETIVEYCESDTDMIEAYRRMVFNVIGANQDDHGKNFSFVMNSKGEWNLSPAYDISHSPGDGQLMSVNGKKQSLTFHDLEKFANDYAIQDYKSIIKDVIGSLKNWKSLAEDNGIPAKLTGDIERDIRENINRIEKDLYRTVNGVSNEPEWFKYTFTGTSKAVTVFGYKQDAEKAISITQKLNEIVAWRKNPVTKRFDKIASSPGENSIISEVESIFSKSLPNKSDKGLDL